MPTLPTKDTKKRFLKLTKKSGKSRTNTMYGATDTSKKKISTYDPGHERLITKFKDFLNENFEENTELKLKINNYLQENYPNDWWENEFQSRVYDYITDDDLIGYGDEDNPDYDSHEEAYKELCTGGAIEHDLLDIISKDIQKTFGISEDEFYKKDYDEIVEEYMVNTIDWYDKFNFGEQSDDPFGHKKAINDMMSRFDELSKKGETDDGIKI